MGLGVFAPPPRGSFLLRDSLFPLREREKEVACACGAFLTLPVEEKAIMGLGVRLRWPFPLPVEEKANMGLGVRLRWPFPSACRRKGDHGLGQTCLGVRLRWPFPPACGGKGNHGVGQKLAVHGRGYACNDPFLEG